MEMENDILVLSGGGRNLINVMRKDFDSYPIPSSVTAIGKKAFKGCSLLLEINVPGNVKNIGTDAFMDCSSLYVVKISEGVATIGKGAFRNCTSLREVYLPSSLIEIGCEAFMNCPSIRKLIIPTGVTKIGTDCFANCKSLKEIVLPNSLKEICDGLFRNCLSLQYINIPTSVVSINKECFSGCKSLERIGLHNIYANIDESCFIGCYKLKSIDLDSVIIEVDTIPVANYLRFKDLYYSDDLSIEEIIDDLTFRIPVFSKEIMIQLAWDSLRDFIEKESMGDYMWSDFLLEDFIYSSPWEISEKRMASICLNYIRHKLTPYDNIWQNIKWLLQEEYVEKQMYEYYNQLLKRKINETIFQF